MRRRIDRANGPKVLAVLRTRWPNAQVSVVRAADGREAELGTSDAAGGAASGFAPPSV